MISCTLLNKAVFPYSTNWPQRSSHHAMLTGPCSQVKDRTFSVTAPRLWNSLPKAIRKTETVDAFKIPFYSLAFLMCSISFTFFQSHWVFYYDNFFFLIFMYFLNICYSTSWLHVQLPLLVLSYYTHMCLYACMYLLRSTLFSKCYINQINLKKWKSGSSLARVHMVHLTIQY